MFAVAALTTAALSLDATIVLLTPVILTTATLLGARPRPAIYASSHLANSASTLLPVSNLTNLLWRQILHAQHRPPSAGRFIRLGVATVPACLVVAVAALWAGVRLTGM